MPYGPIFAGIAIQAGAMMIEAGMKRIIPEIAKLLDEPTFENLTKDLEISKFLVKTFTNTTNKDQKQQEG